MELHDVASSFNCENSEGKTKVSIYDTQKEGYVLCIKASSVNPEYLEFLKNIANSRKLGIRESEGYIIIYGYQQVTGQVPHV